MFLYCKSCGLPVERWDIPEEEWDIAAGTDKLVICGDCTLLENSLVADFQELVCCDECGRPVEAFEAWVSNQLTVCKDCVFSPSASKRWVDADSCPYYGCPSPLDPPPRNRCPICGFPDLHEYGRTGEDPGISRPNLNASKSDTGCTDISAAKRPKQNSSEGFLRQSLEEADRRPGHQATDGATSGSGESSMSESLSAENKGHGQEQSPRRPTTPKPGRPPEAPPTTQSRQEKEARQTTQKEDQEHGSQSPPASGDTDSKEKASHERSGKSGCLTGIVLLLMMLFFGSVGLERLFVAQEKDGTGRDQPALNTLPAEVPDREI